MTDTVHTTTQPLLGNEHFQIRQGHPMPYGATVQGQGVNFSVFSIHAEKAWLVLYHRGDAEPFAEIEFPQAFRIGKTFTVFIENLDYGSIEYGFRMDGPNEPQIGHYFDRNNILLDPYAKAISGRSTWGEKEYEGNPYPNRALVVRDDFDWEGDQPLLTPVEDLIIYEMHVRSFTQHPSSGAHHPGTYSGIMEKIPYLKYLGINCVELLPMFDFDEFENSRPIPGTDDVLVNYWGYSTVGFFAPKTGFAASSDPVGAVHEFKQMVKELHRNGIELILDVVFNHTAEGNENGPTISFRGIDNRIYYMLTPECYYYNFSGTGNTFNCNHPAVIQFILDSLRYWVTEYHVDGFRFDLASILARAEDGTPLGDPPLLKMIAHDPVLGNCKLIAEPWDAGGLYHVGAFPAYDRWAEWNGKYRDAIRKFLKGDTGMVEEVIKRIEGSPDLYPGRGPITTINFLIAHDGFTLADLVSYNDKHNEANLEDNRDGANDNNSWNCGVEGPTDDPEILALRKRQMKNAMVILLVSQGVPMFLMGDEVARTQNGNNNTYCQDNELNYFNWHDIEGRSAEMFRFVRQMIAFRLSHPALRNGHYFRYEDYNKLGVPDFAWFSLGSLTGEDPRDERLTLAFMLGGAYGKGGLMPDNDLFVAINMHWEKQIFKVPKPSKGHKWHGVVNTGLEAPQDIVEPGHEQLLENQKQIELLPRSVVLLMSK